MKKTFKLSLIAATVVTAMNAQAAIYQVVEVPTTIDAVEKHGVAIQPSLPGENCFVDNSSCEDYAIAVEGRKWAEGISYREEVPFGMDNSFYYQDKNHTDLDDFKNYCRNELRYETCEESWAKVEWAGYQKELDGNYTNAPAEVVGGSYSGIVSEVNTVINRLSSEGDAIGNSRDSSNSRNQAFAPFALPDPESNNPKVVESRAFAASGDYIVGSISRFEHNDRGDHHASKAAIWSQDQVIELPWGNGSKQQDDHLIAQGSMRDVMVDEDTNKLYGVGYNTYSHQHMDATIFTCDLGSGSPEHCKSQQVSGTTDREKYSNSVVEKVNHNGVAIGEAKRHRRSTNQLFYIADINSPKAIYLDAGIFSQRMGSNAGGINNRNEMVGSIDLEASKATNDMPRPPRGFIYPLPVKASDNPDFAPNAVLGGKARLLDDLTNGGEFSEENNQYRIINAADINDAGVIAATALKCEGGYRSTAPLAKCATNESVVAVKLVPIQEATSSDIEPRQADREPVKRSGGGGGSLGIVALTALGLLGFRRKLR